MVKRADSAVIDVDESIVMWHTVLQVATDNSVVGVAITNNPLDFHGRALKAQVIMHKTRSVNCAKQVARFVRRHFELMDRVPVLKSGRVIEARIGYACANGYQYEPNERTPGWGLFQHIAATSISELLKESDSTNNAPRTMFTAYEIISKELVLRDVTNKYHSVERWWTIHPPEGMSQVRLHALGRFQLWSQAEKLCTGFRRVVKDELWPRFPSAEYVRRLIKSDEHGRLVWIANNDLAVKGYTAPVVCIGHQVYTERQVRGVLEMGSWMDGRRA